MREFQKKSGVCITLENSLNPNSQRVFLMRLKSVIAFIKYFKDMIISTDCVFSKPCYPHLNTPIDQ